MEARDKTPEYDDDRSMSYRESRDASNGMKRCCCCFNLQRGITLMIMGDFVFFLVVFGFLYYQFALQLISHEKYLLKQGEFAIFYALTGGIISLLLLLKII